MNELGKAGRKLDAALARHGAFIEREEEQEGAAWASIAAGLVLGIVLIVAAMVLRAW